MALPSPAFISRSEIVKHSSPDSCWVILYDKVYDMTDFVKNHPGGANAILRFGGKDGTEEFEDYHSPAQLSVQPEGVKELGSVESASLLSKTPRSNTLQSRISNEPLPLSNFINLDDFETVAKTRLPKNANAYYNSGADDEITKRLNRKAYQSVMLRPRVMRRVSSIDTSTSLLGHNCSMPVFVSPAALAKLADKRGECAIAEAAGTCGIIQVISSSSSMPLEEIMKARISPEQPCFLQLYINPDIEKTKALIQKAESLGVKAIWITVDSPVMGKREEDERIKAAIQTNEQAGTFREGQVIKGIAKTLSGMLSSEVSWDDMAWLRRTTKLPIVLKGIQCVEDAILASENGLDGIVLSNHGGRSQDTSQPSLLTLLEIRKSAPWVFEKLEVYIDGGVRRGTDVLKALALGARAVGVGRPTMYSLAVGHGAEGIKRMLEILWQEIHNNMALLGATNIAEVVPDMVNTRRLERDLTGTLARL